MIIRPEKPEDIAAIRIVNEKAFGSSAEADLVDALRRNGKATLSLVAEEDGQIAGHILFSPVTIEAGGGELIGVGLAPLAVLPEFQYRGAGSALVKHGLDCCREAGHRFAIVLGHPRYYPRFGFVPASSFGIKSKYDTPGEHFMAIELLEGALRNQAGMAKYQPEFDEI
ncbi:MAG: GNAT family N-acetyltransferase [Blastocatellales bacterium]